MDEYYLFLDESETHRESRGVWVNRVFSIAGIIVKKKDHDEYLAPEINRLKKRIWHDINNPTSYILHEKDVRFASNNFNNHRLKTVDPVYRRFKSNHYTRMLYDGMKEILGSGKITTIGAALVLDNLYGWYGEDFVRDKYLIASQLILENFCHFLCQVNGQGHMVYESRLENQNNDVRMRYYQIKTFGTLYASPQIMQERLRRIEFFDKTDNIPGLQLADFIPNHIVKKVSRDLYGTKKSKFNLYQPIRKARYDGGRKMHGVFGIPVAPL